MKVVAHPLLVAVALGLVHPVLLEEDSATLELPPEVRRHLPSGDAADEAVTEADAPVTSPDAPRRSAGS